MTTSFVVTRPIYFAGLSLVLLLIAVSETTAKDCHDLIGMYNHVCTLNRSYK